MCAGGFDLILQVSSTLWPDINRRNYQSTDSGSNGPSVAQEPSSDDRPRPTELGQGGPGQPAGRSWGRLAHLAGRPTYWSADQAHGPHRLSIDTWRLPASCLSRFQVLQPVAPNYKYKGRGRGMDTHTSHPLNSPFSLGA